jgi:hypothetical protein
MVTVNEPETVLVASSAVPETAEAGDPHAAAKLLPLVYSELRKLATARQAEERADHNLLPTALVHED